MGSCGCLLKIFGQFFEREYGMSHNEIRALIANSVAEHFNMKNPKKQTP